MTTSTYLGNNQLLVNFRDGSWVVEEEWENWGVVFRGSFEECSAYLNERWFSYMEDRVG